MYSLFLFLLSIFLLVEALFTKEIKLKGPRATLKENPNVYKLFIVFYTLLVLFSLLCMFGIIE